MAVRAWLGRGRFMTFYHRTPHYVMIIGSPGILWIILGRVADLDMSKST